MDAFALTDEQRPVDGEVVWSRHLDADAKFATVLRIARVMVTKSPITKESTKQPLKPSRGECRVRPADLRWLTRVLFCFAREAAGGPEHPAFPAPSLKRGRYHLQ